jgi:TATA-binding protein-associated factor
MFDEHWDIRHGAALGLRALVCTFKQLLFRENSIIKGEEDTTRTSNNNLWHVDFGVRLICILALDRLGDFFSERTSAPVKETAAQTLGFLISFLGPKHVQRIGDLLMELIMEKDWHIQHGGLLGFKYVLLGDPSMKALGQKSDLIALFGELLSEDTDDDVFSAAVENLILLIERMPVNHFPASLLQSVHGKIWSVLPHLDELHASISNCLRILKIVCGIGMYDVSLKLEERLLILMPLACHPSLGTRLSAISTYSSVLGSMLTKLKEVPQDFWLGQCVFWFELALVEQDAQVVKQVLMLFEIIVKEAGFHKSETFTEHLDHLFDLAIIQDYSLLTERNLKFYSYLQKTNILLRSAAANNTGKKGSKKSSEARLSFGYLPGRSAINVRWDAGHCLALYMCSVGEAGLVQSRVKDLLQANSSCCRLLAYITMKDVIDTSKVEAGLGSTLSSLLSPHISEHVQNTYKGLSLGGAAEMFREVASKANKVCGGLSKVSDSMSWSYGDLLKVPLKEVLLKLSSIPASSLNTQSRQVINTIDSLESELSLITMRLRTMAATCSIVSKSLPPKLNYVIQPLMESVKNEIDRTYQRRCASTLAQLIHFCKDRTPSPNAKLVKNLAARCTIGIDAAAKERILVDLDTVQLGALATLEETIKLFGSSALSDLPMLKSRVLSALSTAHEDGCNHADLLQNLVLITLLKSALSPIYPSLRDMLGNISKCITMSDEKISFIASCCMVEMSNINLEDALKVVFFSLLPLIQNSDQSSSGKGILTLLDMLSETHKVKLAEVVPYILVHVMPLLNSQDAELRTSAAGAFAKMFPIFAVADEKTTSKVPSYLEGCTVPVEEAAALQKIFNASEIDNFELPFSIDCKLRSYQQEGLNWLYFLQRFGMNGILADDMGLGKTIQTLLILASTLQLKGESNPISIIVAPSTLVSHWLHEITKYLPKNIVKAFKYVGSGKEREQLQKNNPISSYNCLITSYDVLRKDIGWLEQHSFQYCILDEGHLIKNADSTVAKACKRVRSEHRLILTGTPIQNDVLEIWSLFDFLMPGFLGQKKEFNKKYRSGVNAAKKVGSTKKDRDASILVADQLHKQISPFILRRTKDMVLKDLPSKIIQDIFLEMSPLQKKIYEEISGGVEDCLQIHNNESSEEKKAAAGSFTKQVFDLAKVCTHPMLAMKSMEASALSKIGLSSDLTKYEDISHSPKLVALSEVLQQCGILSDIDAAQGAAEDNNPINEAAEATHQILVFAQTKGTLDMVEKSLLKPNKIPFLRIDGTVQATKRHDIAMQFQSDPTIPVLLLTTRVGGLGLNLTAADTVFFMEHDWNPMMDMQAMDRAHRLGQKSTVNVFRAIIKDSYEERLMSMQRFKIGVAETVVSIENASINTLHAGEFIDLFSSSVGEGEDKKKSQAGQRPKHVVEELTKNWEELYGGQYDDEFDVEKFTRKNAAA